MKLRDLIVPMCILTLGACTTYTAQTVAITAQDEAAVEAFAIASADVTETDEVVDDDLERVICKRSPVTGSRFTKQLCMTWREWQDRAEDAKNFTNTTQNRTRTR